MSHCLILPSWSIEQIRACLLMKGTAVDVLTLVSEPLLLRDLPASSDLRF